MYIPIISLFVGMYLNIIAAVRVRKKAELLLKNPYLPLPDLIHNNVPKIPMLIPDFFLFICGGIGIFNYNSLLNIEKNLLCLGLCTIIRSIIKQTLFHYVKNVIIKKQSIIQKE